MQVYNSVTGLMVSDFGNERQGVKEAPLTSQKTSVLNSTSMATSCLATFFLRHYKVVNTYSSIGLNSYSKLYLESTETMALGT
jgi:hypothetical protein